MVKTLGSVHVGDMSLLEIAKDRINRGVMVSKSFAFDVEILWNKLFKRRTKHEKDINIKHPDEFTDDITDSELRSKQ